MKKIGELTINLEDCLLNIDKELCKVYGISMRTLSKLKNSDKETDNNKYCAYLFAYLNLKDENE